MCCSNSKNVLEVLEEEVLTGSTGHGSEVEQEVADADNSEQQQNDHKGTDPY